MGAVGPSEPPIFLAGDLHLYENRLFTAALKVEYRPCHRLCATSGNGLGCCDCLLLAFVAVSAMYGGVVFDRLGSTGMAADVRWALYENIWKVALERPLTGHGFDSFELAFRAGHELPVSPDLRWQNAHNTYLELWVELGFILGSLPPLICIVALLRLLKRGASNQYTGYLAQAAVAAIVIAAIHSLVDFSLEIEANVFLFLVILGLGLAPDDSKIK